MSTPDGLPEVILEASGVSAGYHGHPVIHDIGLKLHSGEVAAVIGPNGAGKTTLLLALAGALQPLTGEVRFLGDGRRLPLNRRARQGLGFVADEHSLFGSLSVEENLRVAAGDFQDVFAIFPELRKLEHRPAGLLSGGEQQMLKIARVLAQKPRCMLADEVSIGLSPLLAQRLLSTIRTVADSARIGVLIVEQQIRNAFAIADHVYVLQRGRIVLNGPTQLLRERLDEIESSYLSQT